MSTLLTDLEQRLAAPGGGAVREEWMAQTSRLEQRLRGRIAQGLSRDEFPVWQAAADAAQPLAQATGVTLYPPVPMAIQRVGRVERAQMLLESTSRPALQHLLAQWRDTLSHCQRLPACKGLLRWALDVDPIAV